MANLDSRPPTPEEAIPAILHNEDKLQRAILRLGQKQAEYQQITDDRLSDIIHLHADRLERIEKRLDADDKRHQRVRVALAGLGATVLFGVLGLEITGEDQENLRRVFWGALSAGGFGLVGLPLAREKEDEA
jgi:hypothetical protein